jgi:hypothetical protein
MTYLDFLQDLVEREVITLDEMFVLWNNNNWDDV